jgi:hypothetical protein
VIGEIWTQLLADIEIRPTPPAEADRSARLPAPWRWAEPLGFALRASTGNFKSVPRESGENVARISATLSGTQLPATGVKHAERHAPPARARSINAETVELRRVPFSGSRALQAVTVGPRRGRATAYSHDGRNSWLQSEWASTGDTNSVVLGIWAVVATGTRLRGGATSSRGMPALEAGGWSHSAPG